MGVNLEVRVEVDVAKWALNAEGFGSWIGRSIWVRLANATRIDWLSVQAGGIKVTEDVGPVVRHSDP